MKRFALALVILASCKDRPAPPPPPAPPPSAPDPVAVMKTACLSCHSEEMLAQQRLTPAQWQKTVDKMTSWGANLEPSDAPPLVAYLAATYGPDAGVYVLQSFPASNGPAELEALPDERYAGGDATRGHALYMDKCSGCHGAEARGQIGVRLADRPLLYRAVDLAGVIRRGRGKMPPLTMTDDQIADVLAHLRTVR